MGQTEYLHDKGTDKLIADVLAFDPTKVNAGEADEVPEMFDEMTGPCDSRPPAPTRVDAKPIDWAKEYADSVHRIGFHGGLLTAMEIVMDSSSLDSSERRVLVEKLRMAMKLTMPAASTRKG